MNSKVLDTLKKYNMIKAGDSVTAAVSGGADSVAMLCVLKDLSESLDFSLKAVHINHNLRGDESNRDELFVRNLCSELNIECDFYSVDVMSRALEKKISIELAARQARYEIFSEIGGKIATAHTLCDRAETLIFNITRGSGLHGLRSIPPKRENIIRPLIDCTREEIEQYLKLRAQEYVTDSTNLTDDYTRNKIRHNVIPQLQNINPAFLQAVSRLCESACGADDYIIETAKALENADADTLACQHPTVLAEYVRQNCAKFSVVPDKFHTDLAVNAIKSKSKTQIADNLFIEISQNTVEFFIEYPQPFEYGFSLDGVETPYYIYNFEKICVNKLKTNGKINNLLFNSCFDYDKMNKHIIIRSRRDSDKMRIFGRNCTKTLKKAYNEQKIPRITRGKLAVISQDNDIIWAQNIGVSEKYALDENSVTAVKITVTEKGDGSHKQ